jgi:hypothetical protein
VPRNFIGQAQDMKAAHLRNLYQMTSFNPAPGTNSIGGFGLRHDGTFGSLFLFYSQTIFTFSGNAAEKTDIQAFLLCFDTGTAPAVGYSRTASFTNVANASLSNDWSTLEAQAVGGTNIDLILKGTVDGVRHGLLYQPGLNNYKLDTTNAAALTRAQLTAKIQAGDTLTLMGVPPGSGLRLAIDRNGDGVLDADEPRPGLQVALTGGNFVVHWPLSAAGFVLESSDTAAPGSWVSASNAVEIIGGQNYMTKTLSAGARFYRLRSSP